MKIEIKSNETLVFSVDGDTVMIGSLEFSRETWLELVRLVETAFELSEGK